jgi:hypothetical protein
MTSPVVKTLLKSHSFIQKNNNKIVKPQFLPKHPSSSVQPHSLIIDVPVAPLKLIIGLFSEGLSFSLCVLKLCSFYFFDILIMMI